ncbi:serine hydrolase domain-containing protein [Streptomyces sp. NPDC127105]|uniref:serine hydrolase domain-containing protein n=1 Tax=Streptomyces sp. NPDC127105 TaxID=3345359 RepID=UPI003651A618
MKTPEPGLILRIRPADQPAMQTHVGAASLELGSPISENTTFNVGSVAKQITAYLCVRAAHDGHLQLDRSVDSVLSRFRVPGVTVAELIQHHGGVRDAESMLSLAGFRDLDHYTADDLLQLAYRQQERAVEPGRFLYSNTGYLLLAEVLRHVHGAPLQEIAEKQVFAPLGMSSARFKSDPREVISGAASSYLPTATGWSHQQRPVTLQGPGSLWCTAADLDRWLGHLWNEWQTTQGATLPFEQHLSYRHSDHTPFTYGAGLYADPRPGRTAVFHYGHEQGFSAAARLTSTGLRIVCLSNHSGIAADHVAASTVVDLARDPGTNPDQLLSRALRDQPVSSRATAADDRGSEGEMPHAPIGTYVCGEVPGTVRLTRSGDSLYLWRRGTRDLLTAIGPAAYTADGYTLTLPTKPTCGTEAHFDGFVLDLDRAPGLHYHRCPD